MIDHEAPESSRCEDDDGDRDQPEGDEIRTAVVGEPLLQTEEHDRADGGLFVTLAEMAFAGRVGLDVDLGPLGADPLAALFAEELGAVLQVRSADVAAIFAYLRQATALAPHVHRVARPNTRRAIRIAHHGSELFGATLDTLLAAWSATTHAMQRLREPAAGHAERMTITWLPGLGG